MIRPVNFSFNAETAVNNAFQVAGSGEDIPLRAQQEFDAFVQVLRNEGVQVHVVNDTPDPYTPDSIFPNNWISFHEDGTVFLYPMFAVNRRKERKPGVLQELRQYFSVKNIIDFSGLEQKNEFLEGTGSMVLDRESRLAYACLSPRTDIKALQEWCSEAGYSPVSFHATDQHNQQIYHTNVMMCVADRYVVICLESIRDINERGQVIKGIENSGKQVIEITLAQMNQFAGNMLQVNNERGEKLLIMSSQAYGSLSEQQIKSLNTYNRIVYSPLHTIESNGGGSARCMMAEIHLPVRTQEY